MIKQGLKNFLSSLKYVFTPLGTMFLGLVVGLGVLIAGTAQSVNELISGLKTLTDGMNIDFNAVGQNLYDAVRALDWWHEPLAALETMLSEEWLNATITDSVNTLLGTDYETFVSEIGALTETFIGGIAASAVALILFCIIGFIAGYALTRFIVRRDIAKRSLWKFVLSTVINSVLTTGVTIIFILLYSAWKPSAPLTIVFVILLDGIVALTEAYLLYGRGKTNAKSIVNLKNIGKYFLTNALIFLIAIALSVIAVAINVIAGIFVALALMEIAFIVIGMNAESYVRSVAENSPPTDIIVDDKVTE